jgi:hypothetical protein
MVGEVTRGADTARPRIMVPLGSRLGPYLDEIVA